MKNLEIQGEKTLQYWDKMIKKYEGFWSTPFFFMIFASVLIGIAVSLIFSYYITRSDRALREEYANLLNWYGPEYLKLKEVQNQVLPMPSAEEDKARKAKQNLAKKKQK